MISKILSSKKVKALIKEVDRKKILDYLMDKEHEALEEYVIATVFDNQFLIDNWYAIHDNWFVTVSEIIRIFELEDIEEGRDEIKTICN